MKLPQSVDLTPQGKIVEPSELGEIGYSENVNYNLRMSTEQGYLWIDYYGEDDTFLSDVHPLGFSELITKSK